MSDENQTPEGPSGPEGMSDDEFAARLARMPKAQLRAILAQPYSPTPATPKLSPAIDALAKSERAGVVDACKKLIAVIDGGGTEGSKEFQSALAKLPPDLAEAMQVNSSYRNKPFVHSARVVAARLAAR